MDHRVRAFLKQKTSLAFVGEKCEASTDLEINIKSTYEYVNEELNTGKLAISM